eukprot:TRINITY_DN7776_c0_g1_i1.p1 TRINITY_DN7776_c0_g1~~TRINITY_DN7776_c0_g1_i1.p1  ORF type:complete len:298 (-),score=21.90 TRINITY_DN7776_c0_g1_i1:67-960(-)
MAEQAILFYSSLWSSTKLQRCCFIWVSFYLEFPTTFGLQQGNLSITVHTIWQEHQKKTCWPGGFSLMQPVVEPPVFSNRNHSIDDPNVFIHSEALKKVNPTVLFLVDWFNLVNNHFLLPFVFVLNYVGWWNTFGYWFSEHIFWRDVVYIIIGLTMLYTAELLLPMQAASDRVAKDWASGLPETFSVKRKLLNFFQSQYHFFGSCILWTGAWDLFDLFLWEASPKRDLIYGFVTIALLLFLEQIFSRESLIWLASDKSSRIDNTTVPLESVVTHTEDAQDFSCQNDDHLSDVSSDLSF